MSDVTDVKVWPCTYEAIDWSQDGIIALTAEESVELLFPNSSLSSTEQTDVLWRHIPLDVPWYTTEELPEKEPAPIPTWSIGEEISTSVPTSISWSPPGLAKHRRCALAALTSSLVLSIWSSDGKPQDATSWGRRLVVNKALADYFIYKPEEASVVVSSIYEKARLRTRVRAFAWAAALPNFEPSGTLGTRIEWGQYILAVSNDDNQIAFVIIDSPTSTFGVEDEWTADVINHFVVTPESERVFEAPRTFDDIMNQQRHVSHIAWSPWTIRGEWYHSVLAYATNDDVRARVITYKHDTIGLSAEIVYPKINLSHKGPMKWSPLVKDDEELELALFGTDGLTVLTISATYATILSRKDHDLDHRWDDISGVVWDHSNGDISRLHFSSLHSTMTHPTATVALPADRVSVIPSPDWREQIGDTEALFSAQNDLKGNVRSKVWGLSESTLGDFIATCHTVHPSDMVEYGPPISRSCTIAINNLKSYGKFASLELPARNVSAEGVAFTLKKWFENTVERTEDIPAFKDIALEKMMQAYGPIKEVQRNNITYTSRNRDEITTEFKRNVFLDAETLKDRYTILIDRICHPRTPNTLHRALIAYRLATSITKLSQYFSCASSFSAEILASHHQLVALVNSIMSQDASSSDASERRPILVPPTTSTDYCEFCEAIIPFEDLEVARCTNGHEYPRCGLSFVAIQHPRVTKMCTLCGSGVFSEEFVAVQEENERSGSGNMSQPNNPATNMENEGVRKEDDGKEDGEKEDGEKQDGGKEDGGKQDGGKQDGGKEDGGKQDGGKEDDGKEDGQSENEYDAGGVVETTEQPDAEEDEPLTMAKFLFLACDTCIYCGGKYSG